MKTLVSGLLLFTFFSLAGMAQNEAKIIAVVNEAEWCGTCQKHGERAMTAFNENNQDGFVLFIFNDVTSDETKSKSEKELKKYGLASVMEPHKATGVAYLFNAEDKHLINQVSLSKTDQELIEAMQLAINKVQK